MRMVIAASSLFFLLCATVLLASGGPPPVRWWDDGPGSAVTPTASSPAHSRFTTVQIDDEISYIRYLFMHKQAIILEQGGEFYFYFAYNDAQSHVTTKVIAESDLLNPAAWISQDIVTWTGSGVLRYVSPTAYWDSGTSTWCPQVTFNAYAPPATRYMYDQGGFGAGLWTAPMDVGGPVYDYYLPVTETGPGNVIYMDGVARDVAGDSEIFKSFGGLDGAMIEPPGEVMIFPTDAVWGPNPVYGQGFENSQLLHRGGRIVIAEGGYRTWDYEDHTNPLLVVYRESSDGGLSWSGNVWLDQNTVPDMPGRCPGIEGHHENSFFDGLIESDGDLHFLCVLADSGYFGNTSTILGLYDLHEGTGGWTASRVCSVPPASWTVHSPSLAEGLDGTLYAAWADWGSSGYFDVWLAASFDGGHTWLPALKVTESVTTDQYFPRLVPTTTANNVYILTMPTMGYDGPLDLIQVPIELVPIELAGFSGRVEGVAVLLEWATQSERENFGFNVERGPAADGPFARLNAEIVQGAGTTNVPQSYQYRDETVEQARTYWYRLHDVSTSGEVTTHRPISVAVPATQLRLEVRGQPRASDITFTLSLPSLDPASLRLYDLSGRLTTEVWESTSPAEGSITVSGNAISNVTPGAYAAVLTQGSARVQRGVVVLR